ncbi:hypothetical protein ACLB2K_029068 [Fragaria x ananassa]
MAAMTALQSSMTSLSLSSNSFLGQRLSPLTIYPLPGKLTSKPCQIVVKVSITIEAMGAEGMQAEQSTNFTQNAFKDINLKTKHMKSREEGESGQIIKVEGAIHSSNVMLYSKEKNVASRVGHKILENGQRVRYLIKTGEIIDNAENWKKLKEEKKKTEVAVSA